MFSTAHRFLAFLLFTLFMAITARAEDWPRWRGPHGTGHVLQGEYVSENLPCNPAYPGGKLFLRDGIKATSELLRVVLLEK